MHPAPGQDGLRHLLFDSAFAKRVQLGEKIAKQAGKRRERCGIRLQRTKKEPVPVPCCTTVKKSAFHPAAEDIRDGRDTMPFAQSVLEPMQVDRNIPQSFGANKHSRPRTDRINDLEEIIAYGVHFHRRNTLRLDDWVTRRSRQWCSIPTMASDRNST